MLNDISTSANIANRGLIEAQNIMRNYFPGSTPPPVLGDFTTPVPQAPLTTMTPAPSFNFQTIESKTSNSIINITSMILQNGQTVLNFTINRTYNKAIDGYLLLRNTTAPASIRVYPNGETGLNTDIINPGSYTSILAPAVKGNSYAFFINYNPATPFDETKLSRASANITF